MAQGSPEHASYRKAQAAYMRERRAQDKEVEEIAQPADWDRRQACKYDLGQFILTYGAGFGAEFRGPFFSDQVEQIAALQDAILNGADHAEAAMRAGGKTSILRSGFVWAALYGHSDYSILVGATLDDSADNLDSIRDIFETNDLLFEDFPEVCACVRHLEGSATRAKTQTVGGVRTKMQWGTARLVLPDSTALCPWQEQGSVNAVLECKTIGGAIRGRNFRSRRPKVVGLDDVENDQSAKSETETSDRRRRIESDIGGLGGHRGKLTRVYYGTIISRDCVTAELTDPVRRPTWNGRRYRYLKHSPAREDLWEQYIAIRRDVVTGGIKAARDFYVRNRDAMDDAAVLAWPEGYRSEEYESALEKYYATLVDKCDEGPRFIACEWQNDPDMLRTENDSRQLTVELLATRLNNLEEWRIPSDAQFLTGQVDVHGSGSHLYWALSWWRATFGGGLLAYGMFPAGRTIGEAYPEMSEETAVRTAMADLERALMKREWKRDDGLIMLPVFGEDSGAGQHQQSVFWHCRQALRRNWRPTKGENSKEKDYNQLHKTAKLRGEHWVMSPQTSEELKVAAYMFEANYWKGFMRARLQAPYADPASYTFWGSNPGQHSELFRHCTAEESQTVIVKTTHKEYDQWTLKPNRANHWWDCLVGTAVIASTCGLRFGAAPSQRRSTPREVSAEVVQI